MPGAPENMNNKALDWQLLRYLGYAALFGCVAYLLFLVRGTLPLFFAALLLAYALEPILQRLEARGYSRRAAVGFVFLVFVLLLLILAALLAVAWQQVQSLSDSFPKYFQQIKVISLSLRERVELLKLPESVKASVLQSLGEAQQRAPVFVSGRLSNALTWVLGSLGTLLLLFFILPLITLWMMLEMNTIRARALMLVPTTYRRDVTEIGQSINELLGRYVRGQLIVCSSYGVLCTIAFYALNLIYGMQYALVLGLVASLVYIIPYVGMLTIATAAGLAGYFTSSAPIPCALAAVGACLVFNLIVDYGISPRVLGAGVGLHPLMIILALLSGAQLGGIPGMILAVPFFASLRVILIYLFPQMTAPIPRENPTPGHKTPAVEVVRQTSEAEEIVA